MKEAKGGVIDELQNAAAFSRRQGHRACVCGHSVAGVKFKGVELSHQLGEFHTF
jgi:hypothetical protein